MVTYTKSNLINSDWFDLDELKDEADVLTVVLLDKQSKRVKITFDSYLSFRKIHESFALSILHSLGQQVMLPSTLIEAKDSDYLRWFRTEGNGIVENFQITHYLILTVDAIIEVLTEEPTTVVAL